MDGGVPNDANKCTWYNPWLPSPVGTLAARPASCSTRWADSETCCRRSPDTCRFRAESRELSVVHRGTEGATGPDGLIIREPHAWDRWWSAILHIRFTGHGKGRRQCSPPYSSPVPAGRMGVDRWSRPHPDIDRHIAVDNCNVARKPCNPDAGPVVQTSPNAGTEGGNLLALQ